MLFKGNIASKGPYTITLQKFETQKSQSKIYILFYVILGSRCFLPAYPENRHLSLDGTLEKKYYLFKTFSYRALNGPPSYYINCYNNYCNTSEL